MGTPSIGSLMAFAVDDSDTTTIGDFDANSFRYEVLPGYSIGATGEHLGADGIRGTRSHVAGQARITRRRVGGSMQMRPTPIDLDTWLPRILGAAESTNVFALAETIPGWSILEDRQTTRLINSGCKINRAVFRGASGQALTLALDVLGRNHVKSATSFPGTIPAIDTASPYVLSDLTFSFGADASADKIMDFELTIDNMLTPDRFFNSTTSAELYATDRVITLKVRTPFSADEIDLYDQAIAGGTGSLTFTNGGVSTVFTFANLKCPVETPPIQDKGESLLTLNMKAYMLGSDRELVVTHDSAP